MESDKGKSRVSLRELLPSCITSCVSVRRKDSQGCTADVKDTPPSPEETPDDLIGPDIDLLGDHDDLWAKIIRQSIESIDSGLSLKSNQSKAGMILFRGRSPLSRLDLSSFEKKHIGSDDGFFKSPDDLSAEEMAHQRNKKSESAMRQVSSSFDVSIRRHFVNRVSLRELLSFCITSFSVRRKDSQGCTADVKDTPPSPEEKMTTGSTESIDSGVSFKSDQSKAGRIDFKDRVSPREEMNQELSSEVGWNMVEANAGSCF